MKIYVGGLAFTVTEEVLKETFAAFGDVAAVNLIKDGATGQSRGFGFVEMPVREEAEKAIAELANKEIEGRTISVEQARERARSGGSGPRGGGRGPRGGGGGGFGRSGRGARSGGGGRPGGRSGNRR